MLKGEFVQPDEYAEIQNKYFLPGGETGTAATVLSSLGAKVKNNDYRSIDIGILSAYITAEATAQGLSTCILGWLDDKKLRALCHLDAPVRLVITLGYAKEGDKLRQKKRKDMTELVAYVE